MKDHAPRLAPSSLSFDAFLRVCLHASVPLFLPRNAMGSNSSPRKTVRSQDFVPPNSDARISKQPLSQQSVQSRGLPELKLLERSRVFAYRSPLSSPIPRLSSCQGRAPSRSRSGLRGHPCLLLLWALPLCLLTHACFPKRTRQTHQTQSHQNWRTLESIPASSASLLLKPTSCLDG